MSKEAMKLALEGAANYIDTLGGDSRKYRQALAEQKSGINQVIELYDSPHQSSQQEPVVWMYVNKSTHETKFQKHMRDFVDHSLWSEVPLYGEPLANHELQCVCGAVWLGDELVHLPDKRPPAQRKPLTDEQIASMIVKMNGNEPTALFWRDLTRAIEAAHGIKGEA